MQRGKRRQRTTSLLSVIKDYEAMVKEDEDPSEDDANCDDT
jgi:hypothetical protein